ncbi:porin [Bradyrhizobium liaoningense]|nr:porin [Bradyrhizobium liaoningense]MBR0858057.1 porin [Bradyrhizobium liaoningense]
MKLAKSIFLGSAAGLVGTSVVAAADLPVKARAVEYVKVCSLYGAGFYYIPGTDTCVKLGGYLRVDTTINGGSYGQPFYAGDAGQGNRFVDSYLSRSRMGFDIDTRTASEYGTIRTFGHANLQFNNFGTSNPAVLTAPGVNSNLLNIPGGGYVAVDSVFIQFAGFTLGKSTSAYATPWNGYPGNNTSFLMGGHDSVTGVNNIQYTTEFGSGISGTLGLDDPTVFSRTAVWNTALGTAATGSGVVAYGGTRVPDVVGRMRVDQAWGLFQISAAAHAVNASYNVLGSGGAPTALSEISGHPGTKWGGSVMAALQIKNLPTGAGDDFKIDVTYSRGDTKSVISTSGPSPSFAMFGGSSLGYQSVGFGNTSDGLYLPGAGGTGGIILTTAWGIRGAFNHNWDPYWSTSLWGSFASIRYQGSANDNLTSVGTTSAKGAYCAAFAANHPGQTAGPGGAGTYSCNPDFNIMQLGVVTRWTPVKNLAFSAELGWFHLDQKMAGSSVFAPSAPKPVALYEFKDQNTAYLNLRAQRNF